MDFTILKSGDIGLHKKLAGGIANFMILDLSDALELREFLNEHHRELRPLKNWTRCSYEHHADDCDCKGIGGDR